MIRKNAWRGLAWGQAQDSEAYLHNEQNLAKCSEKQILKMKNDAADKKDSGFQIHFSGLPEDRNILSIIQEDDGEI